MMDGFLVIDKSSGITSYHVIKKLKAIYPFKKIGYIGTLDRNATGILPVALNEGVKLIPFLENGEKTYIARFLLGVTTDTFDLEGTRTSEVDPPRYDLADRAGDPIHVQGKNTAEGARLLFQKNGWQAALQVGEKGRCHGYAL